MDFINYLEQNQEQIEMLIQQDDCSYSWIETKNNTAHDSIVKNIKTGIVLKKMYEEFIAENNDNNAY